MVDLRWSRVRPTAVWETILQQHKIVVNPKSAYHICVIKTFGNIEKPHKERRRHKQEMLHNHRNRLFFIINSFFQCLSSLHRRSVASSSSTTTVLCDCEQFQTQDEFPVFSVFSLLACPLCLLISYFSSESLLFMTQATLSPSIWKNVK